MDTIPTEWLKCSAVEQTRPTWYEFFAGGGMARLGMGERWQCLFSNEWCEKKASAYRAAHTSEQLLVCDVARLSPCELPGEADLVWASFPCQDLSLAGNGAGLEGVRSGTFRPFWNLIRGISASGRRPRIIVLENVIGALSSHGGGDFITLVSSLAEDGYKVGALVMDAARFVPQSRPRLFIIGIDAGANFSSELVLPQATEPWHPKPLRTAVQKLPDWLQEGWLWWNLPTPREVVPSFSSLIEETPTGVHWHTPEQTNRIISLMSSLHLEKLRRAQMIGKRIIGTVYRRTRPNGTGTNQQRAEIRFDQIAGCLRTPTGGSSRQTLMVIEGKKIRSRLLSPREAARLMGVPDNYPLPSNYNDAYHLFGDGLAVPVVQWLSRYLLEPLATERRVMMAA